jgi:PAS domain S-box-containing protein
VTSQATLDVFQAIISHMAEGVIFLDGDDVIRVCNPAAERIRGVLAPRILGRPIFDIHPPKMHHRIRELLAALKSGTLSASNRVIQARNRFFDNSYSAIVDEEGNYLGALLVSRDITEQKRLSEENLTLRQGLGAPGLPTIVAQSDAMKKVLEMAEAVAALDSTLLLAGENGTGKERLVEFIHHRSHRREGPLVRVNCAALPENLLESELFGYARGAFTGAVEDRKGKFELAEGGTLFLDEIGEVPLASQAKLLRAIQEKAVQPLGARREIKADVRIVAASNRDLAVEVSGGRFREDLFYRLNVITLEVPPLRERREDVIPLAELFLERFAGEMKRPLRHLSPQVRTLLLSHPFPGNVRQLQHAMERAVALGKGEVILPDDLPPELTGRQAPQDGPAFTPGQSLKEAVLHFERSYIGQALAHHRARRTETAQALGISRKSLWEKVQRHGLDAESVTEA